VILASIQLGCKEQKYLYVPGVVRITWNVFPWTMIGELNELLPAGTDVETTLCDIVSLFVHTIVLFTPIATLSVAGLNVRL
jgi:cellobiose-specific phosphotransferase system component IIC